MKRISGSFCVVLAALAFCQHLQARQELGAEPSSQNQSEIKIGKLRINKLLILGNSVALHGPAPQIGWTGNWGMAASSLDKDFAHVLHSQVCKVTQGKPKLQVLNLADFERKQTDFDFDQGLKESLAFDADMIIVAVGANAPALETEEAKLRYRTAFEQLLSRLQSKKSTTLLVRGEFWPDPTKEQIMREVCEKAGGTYVPLKDLNKEPANLGSADQKFEHAGVAGHPGDRGMQLIADELWYAIEKLAMDDDGKWFLRFRYGGGTPTDAGRLGHCTATITKSGKVRIESKGRRDGLGSKDVVIFEQDMLGKEDIDAILNAADVALREPPYKRSGANEDGCFFRLERAGSDSARVYHSQMKDFDVAPNGMVKFAERINKLLPEDERIPFSNRANAISKE